MSTALLSGGRSSADVAGMAASIACAIHCAAMPLVIGYLPMLGLSWLADESFHQVMAGVCFVLALFAFLPGWRKHRSLAPACVGSAGVALLAVAAFVFEGECCSACAAASEVPPSESAQACSDEQCPHCLPSETPQSGESPTAADPSGGAVAAWALPLVTPLGGLLLVAGHLVNHRKSCRCRGETCCLPMAEPPEPPAES